MVRTSSRQRAPRTSHDEDCLVVDAGVVFEDDPLSVWLTIVNTCLYRTLSPYGAASRDRLDLCLRVVAESGRNLPANDRVAAIDESRRLHARLAAVLRDVDVLVMPTCASAPPLSGRPGTIDGVPDANWVRFTYPFNLTRSPAAAAVAGRCDDPGSLRV